MVTFEEVRENSDDEEVSTKEGLNDRNQWKCSNLFLKLLLWKPSKLDQMIISIESELRRIESIQSNRNAPKNERKNGVNMIRMVSKYNSLIINCTCGYLNEDQ